MYGSSSGSVHHWSGSSSSVAVGVEELLVQRGQGVGVQEQVLVGEVVEADGVGVLPGCSTSAASRRSRSAAVSSAVRPRVCAQYRAIAATGIAVSGGNTASPSSAARRSSGSAATAMLQGAERRGVGVGAVDVGVAGEVGGDVRPGRCSPRSACPHPAASHRRGEQRHRQRDVADGGERPVGRRRQRRSGQPSTSAGERPGAAGESTPTRCAAAPAAAITPWSREV